MGGPQCRLSNLRNGNVPCPYVCNIHVDFKIVSCPMSNLRNCPCHVINIFSHVNRLHVDVDFKKWPCRPVEFKGQGPQGRQRCLGWQVYLLMHLLWYHHCLLINLDIKHKYITQMSFYDTDITWTFLIRSNTSRKRYIGNLISLLVVVTGASRATQPQK